MKKLYKKATTMLIIIIPAFTGCAGSFTKQKVPESDLLLRAKTIHNEIFTIDTHVDTPITLQNPHFDIGKRHRYHFNGSKVDFPRMIEGGLNSVFFAIFIRQGPLDRKSFFKAENKTLRVLKIIRNTIKRHSSLAQLAFNAEDTIKIKKKGRISVFIGIENGHAIGNNITLIKKYFDLGVRYMTLCHTSNNNICDSSTDPRGSANNGLSRFGREVIKEMNRTGMMIDISHASDKAFYDILKITKSPVIASHSNVRAICDHPRNLSDDMLIAIRKNGGLINVSLWSGYVKKSEYNPEKEARLRRLEKIYNPAEIKSMIKLQKYFAKRRKIIRRYSRKKPGLKYLIDHIDYIVKLVGIDYVGIGSDFDGGGGLLGCLDVSEMGNITLELVKRGYKKSEIKKIWGENLLRVISENLKISKQYY